MPPRSGVKIVGPKGFQVRAIVKHSGCKEVSMAKDRDEVLLTGSDDARKKAKEIISAVLKPLEKDIVDNAVVVGQTSSQKFVVETSTGFVVALSRAAAGRKVGDSIRVRLSAIDARKLFVTAAEVE